MEHWWSNYKAIDHDARLAYREVLTLFHDMFWTLIGSDIVFTHQKVHQL